MKKLSVNSIVVEYNGYTFVKDRKSGYFLSSKPIGMNGKRIHLHRYIWETEVGAIPAGMCVHHKDENKDNNTLENFELMENSKHCSKHAKEKCDKDPDCKEKFIARTNEKSKEWHRSEVGRLWHIEHAKESIGKPQKMIKMICQNCGKEYEVGESYAYKSKYCCRNCKASARRKRIKRYEQSVQSEVC